MLGCAQLQEPIFATVLVGDQIRVQCVILTVVKGDAHQSAHGHGRNSSITGKVIAEAGLGDHNMDLRLGLRALQAHEAQRQCDNKTLHIDDLEVCLSLITP